MREIHPRLPVSSEMTNGSVALHDDPMPRVGDTIRLNTRALLVMRDAYNAGRINAI
jgi:hypothetical protein